jgi:hypothetical protein
MITQAELKRMWPSTENDVVAISCEIMRGGFSSERVFSISTDEYSLLGAAPLVYLFDSEWKPLPDDQPPPGDKIVGFILAKVLDDKEPGKVTLSLPSGDVVTVPDEMIRQPSSLRTDD